MQRKLLHSLRDFSKWSLLLVAISLFVSVPLLAIAIGLFGGVGDMWSHVVSYLLLDYVSNSVVIVLGTCLGCLVMGIPAAWIISTYRLKFSVLLDVLLTLPLAIPSYIMAYIYVGIFGNGGSFQVLMQDLGVQVSKLDLMNVWGLVFVLSLSLFPYVYLPTRVFFKTRSQLMRDNAFLLGASRRKYMMTVALPLAKPAIVGGSVLVMMEVLSDFGAAKYYGVRTFSTGIFRTWTSLEDLQTALYLAALLFVFIAVVLGLVKFLNRNKNLAGAANETRSSNPLIPLRGFKAIAYPLLVCVPVVLALVLPLAQLLYWGSKTFESTFNSEFLWTTLQSLGLAIATALVTVVFALSLISLLQWNRLKTWSIFGQLATLGYSIPGAVIGIGVISSNAAIIYFFQKHFDLSIGYLFFGSSLVLLHAYVFKFLAVAYQPLQAHRTKLNNYLQDSSYLLGKGKLATLFRIELPILKRSVLAAFFLVFIDAMKELPLTLILKPYNLNTLAISIYTYADDEQVARSAIPSMALIVVVAVVMLWANRRLIKE